MKKTFYVAFIVITPTDMTNASAQAAAARHSGVCISPFRGGDSVLQCEYISKVTIRQIYERDFRVVRMRDDKDTATYVMLVIKEQ